MQRAFFTFLSWSLILCACSTGAASSEAVPPSPTEAALALPTTAVPGPETESTAVAPEPQDCGYQWTNQALPELSSSFQQSIQALYPEAQANAYAFGENCVRADGSIAGFTAMETDFNVSLQVDDLANESVLGKRIVQVMQVIEAIPTEQIAGPRPGRVSIVFQSSTAQGVINFYITQYNELPSSFNYAEIYEALKDLQ
ncbi:MAG: hypothetical protein EHM40_19775 [Chloroflexi bacterium]|nr:MAG: hypothetical protein EHM40_19775 [Chloroflexota bacterium]